MTNATEILTDNYSGMVEAVEHVLALGHRRVAYITVASARGTDATSTERLKAYKDTMAAHDIAIEPQWIHPLREPYAPMMKFIDAGRDCMRRWLKTGWEKLGCTALLVQNDDVAIGVIEVLQEAGINVPGDVSVVGFDGTEIAEYFRPRLTTVQIPLHEISRRGTELLIAQLSGALSPEEASAITEILPSRLRVGNSTAQLP